MAATRKLDQSQLELSALGQRQRDEQQTAGRKESARQFDESVNQQELSRWDARWAEQRKQRTQERAQETFNRAQKADTTIFGGQGRQQRAQADQQQQIAQQGFEAEQAEATEEKRQFDVTTQQKASQFAIKTELEAASQGLQTSPRMQQQLEGQARGTGQMGLGIEDQGKSGFAPTEEAQRRQESKEAISRSKAMTDEVHAVLRERELKQRYELKALEIGASKSAADKRANKAALKEIAKNLAGPSEDAARLIDRLRKNTFMDSLDKEKTLRMLANDPNVGGLGEVKAELESGTAGPRTLTWLSERTATLAMGPSTVTGIMPDSEIVQYGTEAMQLFVQNVKHAMKGANSAINKTIFQAVSYAEELATQIRAAAKASLAGRSMQPQGEPGGMGTVSDEDLKNRAQAGGQQQQEEPYDPGKLPANLPGPSGPYQGLPGVPGGASGYQ